MHITKIELTKSRTAGISVNYRSKYNKVTLTMTAELSADDDYQTCYQSLNEAIDKALDEQFKK